MDSRWNRNTVSLVSSVAADCSDASANVLDQLNGGLVPGASSLNCHWTKVERLLLLLLIA